MDLLLGKSGSKVPIKEMLRTQDEADEKLLEDIKVSDVIKRSKKEERSSKVLEQIITDEEHLKP